VHQAVIDVIGSIKSQDYRPYDNGKEFADHELMARWKLIFILPTFLGAREINENTNGLIRQYFPKGMDLRDVTMGTKLNVMDQLNNRQK